MARICIVEDDPHIARMIEATLSIGGYESRICGDGLQAVEEILKGHYDMVLLDVMLPGMDGFEIIGHIRTTEIPVIFLTAKQEVSDKVKGLRLGAEDYIVKPFEAMELLARVEVVLRRTNRGRNVLQTSTSIPLKRGESWWPSPPRNSTCWYFSCKIRIFCSPGNGCWKRFGGMASRGNPGPWIFTCSRCAARWDCRSISSPSPRWAIGWRNRPEEERV